MSSATTTTTETQPETATQTQPEVPANKLYVGNVDYLTTESEIRELFKDYPVESVEIPIRKRFKKGTGPVVRAKGYCFVTFKPEAGDLEEIITKFTDLEFKDRKIYLRRPVITPPEVVEAKIQAAKEAKAKAKEAKKAKKALKAKSAKQAKQAKEESKPAEAEKEKDTTKAKKPTKPAKAHRVPLDQATKSTSTLYIKNLDFSTTPAELEDYFTSHGETVSWVSVPIKKIYRKLLTKLQEEGKTIERRNNGYGFVDLKLKDGESIDAKAEQYSNMQLKDRTLTVRVAINSEVSKTDSASAEQSQEPQEPAAAN